MPQTPDTELELYVRSLTPKTGRGAPETLLGRLESLDRNGVVADVTVTVWGTEIDVSSAAARTDAGRSIRDRLDTFRSWAEAEEVELMGNYEPERQTSHLTGTEHETVTLPVRTLAEVRHGEIHAVLPHICADGTVRSITDHLADIRCEESDEDRSSEVLMT